MKNQTAKIVVLSLVLVVSAVGVALVPQPGNYGFGFLLGLLGLELVRTLRSDS